MAVEKYKYKDKYKYKMYFISYQGKSKLGNYLLAVAKHYIYKNKFSDIQLNINSFISMLKVKFQCERFIANINNKMSSFYQNGPHSIITLTITKTRQIIIIIMLIITIILLEIIENTTLNVT